MMNDRLTIKHAKKIRFASIGTIAFALIYMVLAKFGIIDMPDSIGIYLQFSLAILMLISILSLILFAHLPDKKAER